VTLPKFGHIFGLSSNCRVPRRHFEIQTLHPPEVGVGSEVAGLEGGTLAAGFFGVRFFFVFGADLALVGCLRAFGFGEDFLEALVSPNAFLMFCTLGSEILKACAIFAPVFPAFTIPLTLVRTALVIFARLLTVFRSAFLVEVAPRFLVATLIAATSPLRESNPKLVGNEANSTDKALSRRTTSALALRSFSTFEFIIFGNHSVT
jgi:hypothetical protein